MINREGQSIEKEEEVEVEAKIKEGKIVEAGEKINKLDTKKDKSQGLHHHQNLIQVPTHPAHDFIHFLMQYLIKTINKLTTQGNNQMVIRSYKINKQNDIQVIDNHT